MHEASNVQPCMHWGPQKDSSLLLMMKLICIIMTIILITDKFNIHSYSTAQTHLNSVQVLFSKNVSQMPKSDVLVTQ